MAASRAASIGRRQAARPRDRPRWCRPPAASEHADLMNAGRRARRGCRVDFRLRDPCRGNEQRRCVPRTRPSWKPIPSRRGGGRARKPSAASRRAQFGGRRSVPPRPISVGARRRRQAAPARRPRSRYVLVKTAVRTQSSSQLRNERAAPGSALRCGSFPGHDLVRRHSKSIRDEIDPPDEAPRLAWDVLEERVQACEIR
jgi:hypothetical protein